jgi:hypothetical protein
VHPNGVGARVEKRVGCSTCWRSVHMCLAGPAAGFAQFAAAVQGPKSAVAE